VRSARNSVVSRHHALSLLIRRLPFFDRGIKGIGLLHRSSLVLFQLGDEAGDGLVQFFALAETFAIVLDDESGGDAEKDHQQLTRQSAEPGAPILFLIVRGHAGTKRSQEIRNAEIFLSTDCLSVLNLQINLESTKPETD
jgi:hypothetical protein